MTETESLSTVGFAQKIGMSTEGAFTLVQPNTGEDAFFVMDRLICSEAVSLICVDSVAALLPRSELEGEVGQPQVSPARVLSPRAGSCMPLL